MPAALRTRLRAAVAADEVLRPQRPAVGQLDVDAGVVLGEAGHVAPAQDRHRRARSTQPARMRSMWFCHSASP